MSLPKEELHRLVDALPQEEEAAVRRFLQFVLSECEAEDLLSAKDAAARLGVPDARLRRWLRRGRIPGSKEGRRWFLKEKDVIQRARTQRLF
jgi:excisionase family DNA binding protein